MGVLDAVSMGPLLTLQYREESRPWYLGKAQLDRDRQGWRSLRSVLGLLLGGELARQGWKTRQLHSKLPVRPMVAERGVRYCP